MYPFTPFTLFRDPVLTILQFVPWPDQSPPHSCRVILACQPVTYDIRSQNFIKMLGNCVTVGWFTDIRPGCGVGSSRLLIINERAVLVNWGFLKRDR